MSSYAASLWFEAAARQLLEAEKAARLKDEEAGKVDDAAPPPDPE